MKEPDMIAHPDPAWKVGPAGTRPGQTVLFYYQRQVLKRFFCDLFSANAATSMSRPQTQQNRALPQGWSSRWNHRNIHGM